MHSTRTPLKISDCDVKSFYHILDMEEIFYRCLVAVIYLQFNFKYE